ncbi:MAG: restriction endonuclease subunit S [Candidatus Methanoperedens sp.]|nr:restriction endonuclease subunit S [Candidatus Methanoperedens sp.]
MIKTARAAYGNRLLADLENHNTKFGKGFDGRNLRHIRMFHITFPNWNALRSELSWTQTSYLRKSAESVDKVLKDDPQITQIRADLSIGGIDVRSKAGEEELLTVSSKDGVVPRREKVVTMFMAESYEGYKLCWPGDLVINSLWAWAGGLGFSRHHGIISSAYGVYRPREQFSGHWKYFDYILRSIVYDWEFHVRSKGIWVSRLQLTDPSFLDMPIVLPSNEEAVAIAQFLTRASSLISRFIRIKRRLIELLNEKKQAIIHQAVTRVIDPKVRLKTSGIDWFGDVPEHWEVQKVKQVSKLLVSNVDKISLQNEMPIRLCNYTDVYKNEVISDKINFMVASATKDEINKFKLKIDDVVITKDSEMWNDIGVPALVDYEAPDLICGYHLAILRPDARKMSGEFLLRCFQDRLLVTQLHIQANGITRYGLSQQAIKDCLVPVPPVNDQFAICKILKSELLGLNVAKVKALREIDLLREFRIRLISDVVTGKLDVRGVELPAMDEAAALEDIETGEDTETESEELIESEEVADADE